MPTELTPFDFEGKQVRIVLKDGEPWFVAPDACRVLEMADVTSALRVLDEDEKGPLTVRTPGGEQNVNGISEPGLYKLMMRSRKPAAKRFDRWVRHEVLPTIRKTGGYNAAPMTREEQIAHALIASQQIVTEQRAKIERLEPKALAHDRIADADGTLCITDAAKSLQVQRKDLFSYMRGHRWIYSRPGTSDIAHQDKINSGLLAHKVTAVQRPDGTEKIATQVRVTPKGLTRLAAALNQPSAI